MDNKIFIECADIVDIACDALVLKYAQDFYGVDAMVASLLSENVTTPINISPLPGTYVLLPSKDRVRAKYVLFVGVVELFRFDYEQIREFAYNSLQILAQQKPNIKHIAMTIHGVGYGLDEREAFLAQIAGLLDAFRDQAPPFTLERITIVERNQSRANRLRNILKETLSIDSPDEDSSPIPPRSKIDAGQKSMAKPHVFVAMPFHEDMEDVYIFGIQGPVNSAGYLCERVDMTTFTGDILARIKMRIDNASLVIADLTGANANVYLEVGYAWGKDRPTLLLSKKGEELKFDVKTQRCIFYKNIADLAKQLEVDLAVLSKRSY